MRLTAPMVCMLAACAPKAPPAPVTPPNQALADFSAPADARAWYLKAKVAALSGQQAEAERALAWVIRLDRNSPWAWAAKARLMASVEDWEASALAYTEAYERADDEVAEELSEQLCDHPRLLEWMAGLSPGVRGTEFAVLADAAHRCEDVP